MSGEVGAVSDSVRQTGMGFDAAEVQVRDLTLREGREGVGTFLPEAAWPPSYCLMGGSWKPGLGHAEVWGGL